MSKRTMRWTSSVSFHSPASTDVRIRSFMGRFGQIDKGSLYSLEDATDGLYLSQTSQRLPKHRTLIDDEFLTATQPFLIAADAMLQDTAPSGFDALLLDAVSTYARGVVSPDPSDRLLRAMTSVESLLIANETEPIISNLGLRMAFINGRTVEERRQQRADVQAAYRLRSRFSHHGRRTDEVATVNRGLDLCWRTIFLLVCPVPRAPSKEELLRVLEARILA
jgi:hypothetical protein